MRKFRPNLLNDSLVLTIIITELFRSHSLFSFLKIRLKLDRLLKPQSYPISAIDKEESTKAREADPQADISKEIDKTFGSMLFDKTTE